MIFIFAIEREREKERDTYIFSCTSIFELLTSLDFYVRSFTEKTMER